MVAGCPRDHVLCDLDLLHSLLGLTDVFSQAVQTLLSHGKMELLTDYLNLLVKSENYTAHDPLIFDCEGFQKEGEGTQEKDLLDHGGDLQQFREFKRKATASAETNVSRNKLGQDFMGPLQVWPMVKSTRRYIGTALRGALY